MKIIKLESFANEFVGFIRVTAEDGSTGWEIGRASCRERV